MKTTKRILSIALALALGLALLVPAAASPSVITEVKKIPAPLAVVFTGDTLQFEIDLKMSSDGIDYDLEYVWYDYNWQPGDSATPIATGPKLELPITIQMVPRGYELKTYSVAVNRVTDEGTYNVGKYTSQVQMFISIMNIPSLWWEIGMDLAGGDAAIAGFALAMASPVLLGVSLFLVPLILSARFLAVLI